MTGFAAHSHGHDPGGSPTHRGGAADRVQCRMSAAHDSTRYLAWTNSICLLFLAIGLIGLRPQSVQVQAAPAVQSLVPVMLEPEPESELAPTTKEENRPSYHTYHTASAPLEDTPFVPTVVPVANPIQVPPQLETAGLLAVAPVATLVTTTSLRQPYVPQRPTAFHPGMPGLSDAHTPDPVYPLSARRNGFEGTVIIVFSVGPSGAVHSVRVRTSSGFRALDEAALAVVRDQWRFPSGNPRAYFWSCKFVLTRDKS